MQDGGGRHAENRFFGRNTSTDCPISAKFCMRKQNGMSTRAKWQNLQIFKIQDGARPPFWKSINRHIWVKNRPILMKFATLHHILNPITVTWPKIEISKIQDSGGRHLENRFLGHKSSTDCPISAKFCMTKQNGMSTRAKWQNLQIFKNQDGGRPPFQKSLNGHISVKNRPILMKFDTYSKCCSHVTKNEIFKNYRWRRPPSWKSLFGHNSTDFLISAKFCTRKQNGMPTKATWQKLQIFKIQDDGRPPFWKSLNHHISVKILSDFDKIWCITADIEPDEILKSTITVS